ncbi:MAG: DUF2142 domain-containing protein [Anaerolineae bacterium]|nr:DUF2142 domain-containing protein [Anaerolineae bacterium]
MKRFSPISLILLLYLVVGSLYAILTPAWQAPDEPAHYNFVRQLAAGTFPVIEPSDYDQLFQGEAISARFDPVYEVPDRYFSYEDWQPPLYYALLVPVYWLFAGALIPLRLASLLLGVGTIWLTYRVAGLVLEREEWALVAAAFVAFLPQHIAILAAINNDALAGLLIAAILFKLVGQWGELDETGKQGDRFWSGVGGLLGLGLLTKGSVYIMAPVIGLVLLRHYGMQRPQFWRAGLLVGGAAALIASPWWLRNSLVYGGLDIIAWQAHGELVVGQPRTSEWLAEFGVMETMRRFAVTTFRSFWGQFGWMGVVMPTWVYQTLLLFTLVVMGGWAAAAYSSTHQASKRFILHPSSFILLLTLLFTLLLYLGYNLTYVQHQGRYLFPALIPIACGAAVGLGTVWDKMTNQWGQKIPYLLPLGLTLALVGLDLLALFRFILPQLRG